jgi:hypothetical protein
MLQKLILAAVAAAPLLAGVSAHAAATTVALRTDPASWGPAGATADFQFFYDTQATGPLTITVPFVADITGNNVSQTYMNGCGTPIRQNEVIVGYTMNPGTWCWIRAFRTADAVEGLVTVQDTTKTTVNISQHVRGSLDIGDSSGNVLTHAQLH